MKKEDVQNKRISILGAGQSGLAAARLLSQAGAMVFVSEKEASSNRPNAVALLDSLNVQTEFGGHSEKVLKCDWLVVSPGIDLKNAMIQQARSKGLPVFGELEVASWFCQCPIAAITGSNGKSTTTTLLGEMFRIANIPCVVAGNIGEPFSDHVSDADPTGVAVVEVSSFQLELIESFRPKSCVYLNLTPDHLDRHGSLTSYGEIKARIFKNQSSEDFLIYNAGDEHVTRWVQKAISRKIPFHTGKELDEGGFIRDENLILKLRSREEVLIPLNQMFLIGMHNAMNALAASLAARSLGVEFEPIRQALKQFKGLAHRLEWVRELDGIQYINDSKATNVDSVWFALGAFSRPIVLIAGGRDKDSDFGRLKERLEKKVKTLILIGEAADKMEKAFQGIPLIRAASLEQAVFEARRNAVNGDVVLLSPACASFDMFRDFMDRGEQFKKIVGAL